MPVQVLGLKELQAGLEQLPAKIQRNVVAAGNRAVANEMKKHIQGAARNSVIRNAVTVEVATGKRSHSGRGYIVGLRKPWSRMSHWFEFGTGPRYQKKTGRFVGSMPAQPWLRPALESIGAQVEAIWAKAASRNFALQLKKIGKP